MRLHTADGARKYLTAGERDAFLRHADVADRAVKTLCMILAYAGCRLSEALALTVDPLPEAPLPRLNLPPLPPRRPATHPMTAAMSGGEDVFSRWPYKSRAR